MQQLEIGYFSRTHGVKGQLVLRTEHDLDLDSLKAVFVDVRGARAPFFVSRSMVTNNGIVLTLEDINTVEQARTLMNKSVFALPGVILDPEEADDLTGYELCDVSAGPLGHVKSIEDHGAQQLFVVNFKGKDILLPVSDDLIEEIDDEKRVIRYKAPDGLIDMQLGG